MVPFIKGRREAGSAEWAGTGTQWGCDVAALSAVVLHRRLAAAPDFPMHPLTSAVRLSWGQGRSQSSRVFLWPLWHPVTYAWSLTVECILSLFTWANQVSFRSNNNKRFYLHSFIQNAAFCPSFVETQFWSLCTFLLFEEFLFLRASLRLALNSLSGLDWL